MGFGSILFLVILGVLLILVEIIFIPGTTVIGVVGFLIAGTGIGLSYKFLPVTTANYIVLGSVSLSMLSIYLSFKFKLWELFSLKKEVSGKVNELPEKLNLKIGDIGVAISALRPMGTAEFEEEQIEVTTEGGFVQPKQQVEIIHIERNKIIVQQITN